MRLLISALMAVLTAQGFSQEINKTDANGKKHGLWRGTYEESKRPKYEGTFDHGKETGIFKFFDDTKAGTVIATRDFDRQPGAAYTTFYDQHNNKVSEGNVVNKQYDGVWTYYHRNSKVVMTTENYKAGKLEGVRSVYYMDGKIAEETTYKNGVKDGPYKKYAENGMVLEEATFKNGQYHGRAIYRDIKGKILAEGEFKEGAKNGMWTITEDGKTRQQKYPIRGKQSKTK